MTKKDFIITRLRELLTVDQIKQCETKAQTILTVDQRRVDQKVNQYKQVQELKKKIGDKMGF